MMLLLLLLLLLLLMVMIIGTSRFISRLYVTRTFPMRLGWEWVGEGGGARHRINQFTTYIKSADLNVQCT